MEGIGGRVTVCVGGRGGLGGGRKTGTSEREVTCCSPWPEKPLHRKRFDSCGCAPRGVWVWGARG